MKKALSVFLILMLVSPMFGQDDSKKVKKPKEGWKFGGALPAVTFDSDLGFQYGALFEFFNYGKPGIYPEFLDHTYTEVSHFTKGSGIYRMMYESNHLIGKTHLTFDISYLPDQANHFYGFNGYESVFNKPWMDDEDASYLTRMFYRQERNQFRIKFDIQGKLTGDNIKWCAGFGVNNFVIRSVDIAKLNKGKDAADLLPLTSVQPGLYEIYRDSLDLITANEADGGWVNVIKAGIMWDSRDNKPNPMKGIWTEAGIEYAPGFLGNDWSFAKFYFTHRQYFTLVPENLSLVYRLGFQNTIGGDVPYFYQSQVITSMLTGATNEGLGGSSTLRGVLRNRVIGDGIAYGNAELRWKMVRFKFINQNWYLGTNYFFDAGIVTDPIDVDRAAFQSFLNDLETDESISDFLADGKDKPHMAAGLGLKIAMNENFIISADIGKALKEQDGGMEFYIGLNYLF